MTRPIAITIGDPAGVGPELCLALLEKLGPEPSVYRPVIVGDWQHCPRLHDKCESLRASGVLWTDSWKHAMSQQGPVWYDPRELRQSVPVGEISAPAGRASFAYVTHCIDAALAGDVAAIVTGPIHKQAWQRAGIEFPGHTELLVERTGAKRHAMMLTSPQITCSLVTTHVGIRDVANLLAADRIVEVIELTRSALAEWLGREPVIGVLGLNPHAGEGGRFGGGEEESLIIPAIKTARDRGIRVEGPLPPDTAFLAPKRAAIDGYVCMYHDQGLIPLKTLAFDEGVNVTLGLPVIRTSVDHGPAFDLAGTGSASPASLLAAYELAVRWASGKRSATTLP